MGSSLCGAQVVLQFGEELLDRVEVGRVFGQEEELGSDLADRLAHGFAFVAAEIVHHHDVSLLQGGSEHLLDIDAEALAVDRPLDHPGGIDPVTAQGREEGGGVPMAEGGVALEARAAGAPAPQGRHVGLDPGLIDEDEAGGVDARLIFQPLLASAGDVRAALLAGDQRLFLCVSPCARTKAQTAQ